LFFVYFVVNPRQGTQQKYAKHNFYQQLYSKVLKFASNSHQEYRDSGKIQCKLNKNNFPEPS